MTLLVGRDRLPDPSTFRAVLGKDDILAAMENRKDQGEAWRNLIGAQFERWIYTDNVNAREAAFRRAYDDRIEAIFTVTGQQLENPLQQADDDFRNAQMRSGPKPRYVRDIDRMRQSRTDAFNERLSALADQFPDEPDLFRTLSLEDAIAVTQRAQEEHAEAHRRAAETGVSDAGRIGADILGGLGALFRDPLQVGALGVGGGAGTGRTVAARLFQVILSEAAVNAGVEGAVQLAGYNWRKQAGLDASVGQSLQQVGLAALFGGGFGGLFQGGAEVAHALGRPVSPDLMRRAAHGDADAVFAVAETLGTGVNDRDRRLLTIAGEAAGDDAAAFGQALDEPGARVLADEVMRSIEHDAPFPAEIRDTAEIADDAAEITPDTLAPADAAEPGSADELADLALAEAGYAEADLWDALPVGKDAEGNTLHATHEDMMADAERDGFLADLVQSCKE